MMPYLTTEFGNPSSSHYYGQEPKKAVFQARLQIAWLIGLIKRDQNDTESEISEKEMSVIQQSIIFTGCGTEADNLAIHLAIHSSRRRRPGTENVPYIVSLGKAAALLSDGETWKKNAAHMENCRERMIARISKRLNRSMFRINVFYASNINPDNF